MGRGTAGAGTFQTERSKSLLYGAWQKPLRERKALCRTC